MSSHSIKNFFYRMLCGAFLGISVIAPGISGSIMAVMMGMYDDLITVISNPFKNFKKNVIFLLPMGLGAVISMLALIKALDFLFANYTVPAYLLFMSLILGSVPTVIEEAKKDTIKKKYFIGTAIAFAFALTIGLLAKFGTVIPIDTTNALSTSMRIYIPICCFVAGMMSMLPGMSISMLLMMFSIYEPLLSLMNDILPGGSHEWFSGGWYSAVLTAASAAVAFIVGMVLFSNVTKRILDKHHSFGFLMVLGFMFGSMISVFPGLPSGALNWVLSIIAVAVGVSVSVLFKYLGKKFNVKD